MNNIHQPRTMASNATVTKKETPLARMYCHLMRRQIHLDEMIFITMETINDLNEAINRALVTKRKLDEAILGFRTTTSFIDSIMYIKCFKYMDTRRLIQTSIAEKELIIQNQQMELQSLETRSVENQQQMARLMNTIGA